ncbi:kinase-like domain-containing protein [Amanita rubescens]|nr:kinase-like domain-containing protein [Amanita rubescens]KAF8339427.1 kinase-like domain-containing protein [Amanita rubescens]
MFKLLAQRPVTPKSLFITGVAAELNLGYLGIGGFGCVFKGEYRGKQVAVKVLIDGHRNVSYAQHLRTSSCRFYLINQDSVNKDFCREALAWRSLSRDQHILPLLGIFEEGSRLFLVSPFMENGTLGRWRRSRRPNVEEIQKRIFEVAEGMQYIHSQGIVHGDLRGENVLLDASFHSRITDFGLTRHSDVTITNSATSLTLHFAAPELFGMCNKCGQFECDCRGTDLKDTHMRRKTSQTDVYAFGCLYYEIYFGIAPFSDLGEYQIIKRVTDGERPWRLETPRMGDVTWDLIQNCWAPNPSARPNMEDVVVEMTSILRT